MARMFKPETTRLDLSDGDFLIVKKRLTAGEQRKIFARMVSKLVPGEKTEVDPMQAGIAKIVEYLLDWSIVDADNKPVDIRNQPPEFVAAALNALDGESYAEIRIAIDQHEERVAAETLDLKKMKVTASVA